MQTDNLVMVGIGTDGSDASLGRKKAIHLRWQFPTDQGFPLLGFELYRRPHDVGKYSYYDWTSKTLHGDGKDVKVVGGKTGSGKLGRATAVVYTYSETQNNVTLKSTTSWTKTSGGSLKTTGAGRVLVEPANPMRKMYVAVTPTSGTVTVTAYDGEAVVYNQSLTASANLTIEFDRITSLLITYTAGCSISKLGWIALTPTASLSGWTSMGTYNLPTSKADALNRVATPFLPKDRDLEFYKSNWQQLDRAIHATRAGAATLTSTDTDTMTGEVSDISLGLAPQTILQLASYTDTGIARELGLYAIDMTAVVGDTYDYMVVRYQKVGSRVRVEASWICYGLKIQRPAALTAPTGLKAEAKSILGGVFSQLGTSQKTQTGAGLVWDIPGDSSSKPIAYHLYRSLWAGGAWKPAKKITAKRPVVVSDGTTSPYYFSDGPLDDGLYQYQLSSLDIFGRESALTAATSLMLADTTPPPPPVNVAAFVNNTTRDVDVTWEWGEAQVAMAGDAKSFDVYYASVNVQPLEGVSQSVGASATHGDGYYDIVTDLDPSLSYTSFIDGRLINNGAAYTVVAIDTGSGKTIVTVSATAAEGSSTPPSTVGVRTAGRNFLRTVSNWWEISGRIILQADWSNPTNWNGRPVNVRLSSASPVDGVRSYRTTLRRVSLLASRSEPIAWGLVGICTTDESGNRGIMSAPVPFSVRYNTAPSTVTGRLGSDTYATRADYYGQSRYALSWTAEKSGGSPDPAVYYEVLRASDVAIAGAAARAGYVWSVADSSTGSTAISLDSLGLSEHDSDLRTWAADAAFDKFFVNVGALNAGGSPLSGSDADSSGKITYTDSFPGTGIGRYFFRVRPFDQAGNRGALSAPTLVKLHDVTPPKTPAFTSIVGGDRQIVLAWAKNREYDLASYQVYRASNETDAADPRSMTLVATIPAIEEDHDISYTDSGLIGFTDYYYCMTATDRSGNESPPSAVRIAKAYDQTVPDAPVWDSYSWRSDSSAVDLAWTPADATSSIQVERSLLVPACWQNISSGWLAAGTSSYVDETAPTDQACQYRLRVKAANGQSATSDVTDIVEVS